MAGRTQDGDVRSYVVWVPVLGAEESHVRSATRVVAHTKAAHFWDGHGALVSGLQPVLGISEPAWDIYMIFDRQVRWEDGLPPMPDLWMHQLGSRVDGAPLDATVFAARVGDLMEER